VFRKGIQGRIVVEFGYKRNQFRGILFDKVLGKKSRSIAEYAKN
jgi:hypothetical protein